MKKESLILKDPKLSGPTRNLSDLLVPLVFYTCNILRPLSVDLIELIEARSCLSLRFISPSPASRTDEQNNSIEFAALNMRYDLGLSVVSVPLLCTNELFQHVQIQNGYNTDLRQVGDLNR